MQKSRLLVVVNLNASRSAQSIGQALACLTTQGFDLDVRQSVDRESLARLVRECIAGVDAVIVAGGDGTVNGAIPALIDAKKPVIRLADRARTSRPRMDKVKLGRTNLFVSRICFGTTSLSDMRDVGSTPVSGPIQHAAELLKCANSRCRRTFECELAARRLRVAKIARRERLRRWPPHRG